MSAEDDKHEPDRPPGEPNAGSGASGLPRPVQEHLGQQLRSAYIAMDEKPAFLGDANVPPELDRQLQRLETRERIRHKGLEAVKSALEGAVAPDDAAPGTGRRRRP